MVPEKKKKSGICVRSWYATFLEHGCPQTEKGHCSLCVRLCSCFVSPPEPRDSTEYFAGELMLELADALGQAPGITCTSGISEAFPLIPFHFP